MVVVALRVNTCALRTGAQEVWSSAGRVGAVGESLQHPAGPAAGSVEGAVSAAGISRAVLRAQEVLGSLGWGLELLSASLEQAARWYELAEAQAAQRAQATGVPVAEVYGPPAPGPVGELAALGPVQGPPGTPRGPRTSATGLGP